MFRKMMIAALLSTIGLGTMASTASANEGGRARVEVRSEAPGRVGLRAGQRLGRRHRLERKRRRAARVVRRHDRRLQRHLSAR